MADSDTTTNDQGRDIEPATKHDVKEGGVIGAVGGAIVGAIAAGPLAPIGAIIGAIAGGAAAAAAVNVVDQHDHDYERTVAKHDTTTVGTTSSYANDTAETAGAGRATEYTGPGDYQRTQTTPVAGSDTDTLDTNASYRTPSATGTDLNDTDQTVRLHAEELSASTHPVQTGEVTLRKEVITETRSIDVPVTREEVVIERRAASGSATGTDFGTTEEVIRVPVMEERVTVEKTPVVTEEVSLGKRTVTETQHVTGTVRHEEVRIENPDDVDVTDQGKAL